MKTALLQLIKHYWGIALLVFSWQAMVMVSGFNEIVVPSTIMVIQALVAEPLYFLHHSAYTFSAAIGGLMLGIALGLLFASLAWLTPVLNGVITPATLLVRSIPIVAFIPIVIRLAGYGSQTILLVTVMLTFFPCYVFALTGLRSPSKAHQDFFASLGCRPSGLATWRFYWRLALPSAVPNLLTALRLLAPTCVLVALVAEFLMGAQGLGYVMVRARSDLRMDVSWAAAMLATVFSVAFFVAASRLEAHLSKVWRH